MKRAASRAGAALGRSMRRVGVRVAQARWEPRSHLFVVGEGSGWSVDEDAAHLERTARRLGVKVAPSSWACHARWQAVFLTSQFAALRGVWVESTHELGFAYYHGRPGTPGHPEFDRCFEALRSRPARFAAIQVTHAEIDDLVRSAGVEDDRVFRIPIGIDLENFPLGTDEMRAEARATLGLPETAFVVGSFQKDGVGWAEGLEPKLVKGPDVLVDTMSQLHRRVPELVVLLAGPARGYVRKRLEQAAVPYRVVRPGTRVELARAYRALDAYVIPSRQEGGPKAALEAMASGVPLVSTSVGQVPHLVHDGSSGFVVQPEDAEALAGRLEAVRDAGSEIGVLRVEARGIAETMALDRLDPLWQPVLDRLLVRGRVAGP